MSMDISPEQKKIQWSLFLLRLGVFIVMFAWTLDKFHNPGHGARVFEHFFYIKGLGNSVIMGIGAIELVIIFAFMAGLWKRYTYGFVMILHGVSTLSSWKQYSVDINLLFFAAWPMLAACIALYMLRDLDVKFTFQRKKSLEAQA
ncbi:MAG: hypothetical protein JKY45_10960 [Emcibacter sp.]|nr:hypothetical protein [Emcibacter sp.]